MGTLDKIGFFDTEPHPVLEEGKKPTFGTFLDELLKIKSKIEILDGTVRDEKEIVERLVTLGICKEPSTAMKTVKTIRFLGLHEQTEIPVSCRSAFDVTRLRMEERLAYSSTEQDMVLLHHEVEVDFPDGQPTEIHQATLLEFGRTKNGKTTTAMALTVGIPAAIGALLLLENKIKTRGVLRPLKPEVYLPVVGENGVTWIVHNMRSLCDGDRIRRKRKPNPRAKTVAKVAVGVDDSVEKATMGGFRDRGTPAKPRKWNRGVQRIKMVEGGGMANLVLPGGSGAVEGGREEVLTAVEGVIRIVGNWDN
ncbi:hypothetical protein HHK36_021953 [Tetracentron sinense]|uniref:Saccharopine dehydrogenase-like C-terminal domain-containing protein n=1 Tax=Tetracentron sinense TaxID=13715 RepID=A0A835D8B8_TETSI|nr:hypothetical protein HHK36_021953 [Tetracentron sinense]